MQRLGLLPAISRDYPSRNLLLSKRESLSTAISRTQCIKLWPVYRALHGYVKTRDVSLALAG